MAAKMYGLCFAQIYLLNYFETLAYNRNCVALAISLLQMR